jgi:glucosyl-dolichyl phosphate glucuronosyltransferase
VLCTYNRAQLLAGAVRSLLAQGPLTPAFELLVVDNNSTDRTREFIEELAADDPRVRYIFESQQGLSYARNTGIREARGRFIAFFDDDLVAGPDWVSAIIRAFREFPTVDLVGGRLLPRWPVEPPSWLTPDHWAPLALADHGDEPIIVTAERPIALVGAGACRRDLFEAVGTFATDFQRVRDSIGSLEDHEFMLRVLRTGRRALYDPRLSLTADVQPSRLDRDYHRRWHTGHGHFHALLRSEHLEQTRVGRLLGVPGHLYRQAFGDVLDWVAATVRGNQADAFRHEVRLRFFHGFFRTRLRQFLTQRRRWLPALTRLPRLLTRRRGRGRSSEGAGALGVR